MKFQNKINLVAATFIFLFTYTAISKLLNYESFRITLSQSPLIGPNAKFISVALPITELIVAALLFFSATQFIGFIGSLSLMLVFTIYLSCMILFAEKLPCSCGGVLQRMSWQQHVWFNLFFTLLAGLGLYLQRRNKFHSSFAR